MGVSACWGTIALRDRGSLVWENQVRGECGSLAVVEPVTVVESSEETSWSSRTSPEVYGTVRVVLSVRWERLMGVIWTRGVFARRRDMVVMSSRNARSWPRAATRGFIDHPSGNHAFTA